MWCFSMVCLLKARSHNVFFMIFVMLILLRQGQVLTDENPLLMVISLDGFRPDYLFTKSSPMNELKKIYRNGVSAPFGMIPCFTTKTFPNHYSIATGLFEESHGIIDNEMYNANKSPAYFHFSSDRNSSDWWDNGFNMPIWILNQKAKGRSSGVIMWPGGGATINNMSSNYWIPFNESSSFEGSIDLAFSFMTSKNNPANCIFLYFHQPDMVSHRFGPFANETMVILKEINAAIGYLLQKIQKHDLEDSLNVIILSDHGMESIKKSNHIVISDVVPLLMANVSGYGPFIGVVPHQGKMGDVLSYMQQKSTAHNFTVIKRNDLPDRMHYKNNENIPEILLSANIGFKFTESNDTRSGQFRGAHGYDNKYASMRALFVAQGPAFKKGVVAEPFLNVHLYPLMCKILGLKPPPNNGSFDAVSFLLKSKLPVIKSQNSTYDFHDLALIALSAVLAILVLFGCAAVYVHMKRKGREYQSVATEFDLSENVILFERTMLNRS